MPLFDLLAGAFLAMLATSLGAFLVVFAHRSKLEAYAKMLGFSAGVMHNIPEGLSIASAFSLSPALGWTVAVAISVQDVVEGFAVAAPLAFYGTGLRKGVAIGVFSGFVELAAAAAGFFVLSHAGPAVPLALAFSSGCMAFVVFKEMLPDALKEGGWKTAASFALGAALAWTLAAALGF